MNVKAAVKSALKEMWFRLPHIRRRQNRYLAWVRAQYDYSAKPPSILTPSCIGGLISHNLGLAFRSPTVNLWMDNHDFVKFACDLQHYLSMELTFLAPGEKMCIRDRSAALQQRRHPARGNPQRSAHSAGGGPVHPRILAKGGGKTPVALLHWGKSAGRLAKIGEKAAFERSTGHDLSGGKGGAEGPKAVSYTHLDVYKRQGIL